eukprot:5138289-Amphidinium_carterae.1
MAPEQVASAELLNCSSLMRVQAMEGQARRDLILENNWGLGQSADAPVVARSLTGDTTMSGCDRQLQMVRAGKASKIQFELCTLRSCCKLRLLEYISFKFCCTTQPTLEQWSEVSK